MSKIFNIREKQFKKLVNLISEDSTEERFDEEDYIEVFIKFFRKWIEERHGEGKSSLPLSYLLLKYLDDFIEEYKLNQSIESWRGNLRNMAMIGRELIKRGKSQLQTMRPQQKFTSKFSRPLEIFVKQLGLPEYISFIIQEEKPYELKIKINVDWEKMIRSASFEKGFTTIKNEFEKKIQDFLGVEFGNPIHGELKLDFDRNPNYFGYENWVKQSLNKVIKKQIRELPQAKALHRIKFEIDDYRPVAKMTLVFKDYTPNFGYNQKKEFVEQVKNILTSAGYNSEAIKVSF